jgi:hypothetical protein
MDDSVILTDTCRQLDAARLKIAELEGIVGRKTALIGELTDRCIKSRKRAMPLDRANEINAACCSLALSQLGILPDPDRPAHSIADYTLAELLEASRAIQAAEEEAKKTRQPGEGYTLHTTCDDRLLAALYACQHYEGQDQEEGIEPIAVIGRKALCVVNLPERRDEE